MKLNLVDFPHANIKLEKDKENTSLTPAMKFIEWNKHSFNL